MKNLIPCGIVLLALFGGVFGQGKFQIRMTQLLWGFTVAGPGVACREAAVGHG